MRLLLVFVITAVLVFIPFLIVGGDLIGSAEEGTDATQLAVAYFQEYGTWAWLVGLALLSADLVLPIPATAVISALGILYGPVLGSVIGAAGSVLAGLIAYALARAAGRPAAVWLAGEDDLKRGEQFFSNAGGYAVALSRWMPLLPEAIACLAGMARMPFLRFFIALVCGSVPMAIAYAILGWSNAGNPTLALALSATVPPVLWLIVGRVLQSWETPTTEPADDATDTSPGDNKPPAA